MKVIKIPSCKAWGEERPGGLIKRTGEDQALNAKEIQIKRERWRERKREREGERENERE
jgi:hypothetical protein